MTRRRRRPRRRAGRGAVVAPTALLLLLGIIALTVWYSTRFPEQAEKTVYPLAYRAEIENSAAGYGLDPARVAAVIFCESSFRPEVVSPAGARGLMQIMPDTGKWIAGKLGEKKDFTEDALLDPVTSIRYGCWYLNYLDGRFDGDLTKATAAYHAGEGRVEQWLKNEEYSPDGQTLSVIPIDATRAYVRRVRDAYAKYKEIYADADAKDA